MQTAINESLHLQDPEYFYQKIEERENLELDKWKIEKQRSILLPKEKKPNNKQTRQKKKKKTEGNETHGHTSVQRYKLLCQKRSIIMKNSFWKCKGSETSDSYLLKLVKDNSVHETFFFRYRRVRCRNIRL